MVIPQVLISFLIIGVPILLAIQSTLSLFYPPMRTNWRGTTKTLGRMSSLGAALFADAIALIVLGAIFLPLSVMDWLTPCLLVISLGGFILMVFGYYHDTSSRRS